MKVKVCGLRDPTNITAVSALHPAYLGFVFHPASPRFAGQASLSEWVHREHELLREQQLFGVFVNAEVDYILNTVHDYRLDWVQLHGDESAGYCQELKLLWSVDTLRKPGIAKAFSITPDFDFKRTNPYVSSCGLFVFDTGGAGAHGGTGKKWNWEKLREYTGPVPFLLSGGIGPEDTDAVNAIDHPQLRGIDINSRFETQPGIKDTQQLELFFRKLN
ncbi:phosphoribosylanthranilate isomerase [Neolewinella xylanilytica]|uniref:N-(5'-phosphoribosyl)anthranilate isomerase n=1 Tax=Neolewinella xylanilytica TaxID=1514080 RepID=A0A2S6HZS7_9BACT|nr:phosphoribosylanthranilate isomerase [Neolewinella xylanilytica]PPK84039.1 phosphoribosylanthranilate isomerase [Neolewinella xylanilytica]